MAIISTILGRPGRESMNMDAEQTKLEKLADGRALVLRVSFRSSDGIQWRDVPFRGRTFREAREALGCVPRAHWGGLFAVSADGAEEKLMGVWL